MFILWLLKKVSYKGTLYIYNVRSIEYEIIIKINYMYNQSVHKVNKYKLVFVLFVCIWQTAYREPKENQIKKKLSIFLSVFLNSLVCSIFFLWCLNACAAELVSDTLRCKIGPSQFVDFFIFTYQRQPTRNNSFQTTKPPWQQEMETHLRRHIVA